MHKIRNAMANDEIKLLAGVLEMDGTYIDGKPRKSNDINNPKPNSPRGRGTNKNVLLVLLKKMVMLNYFIQKINQLNQKI